MDDDNQILNEDNNPESANTHHTTDYQKPQAGSSDDNNPIEDLLIQAYRQESFTGPLPHPKILALYEEIVPGSADRIISMAENQANHRTKFENTSLAIDGKLAERGQIFAFIIAVICIISTIALALSGHDTVAGVLGGTTIVGLVTTFLGVRHKKNKEAVENSKEE